MRLVAVLAVLAGLMLLHSPHCADGMVTDVSTMAPGSQQDCADPVAMAAVSAQDTSSAVGGIVSTCLAFIVFVLAAVAGLRPSGLLNFVRTRSFACVAVIRAVQPQAPSLTRLCLLRA